MLEHLAKPKDQINDMLEPQPRAFLLSTVLWSGEDSDWWYLSADSGQHVFFWSSKAIHMIAGAFNYRVMHAGNFILLYRKANLFQRVALRLVMSNRLIRIFLAVLMLGGAPGVGADFASLEKNRPSTL